jgi:hypothetical protein
MRNTIGKIALTVLVFSLVFVACKKDELKELCHSAPLHLSFSTVLDGANLQLNDTLYTDYMDRAYRVELLKFYLSNWSLEKKSGERVPFGDIVLFDYSQTEDFSFDMIVDTGVYKNLHFAIGLDSLTNTSDPATFASAHPLSIAQNTYWTWATKYKFFMLEGRVSPRLGVETPTSIFSYHTGFDELYREISLPLNSFFLTNEGDSIAFSLDLGKVFEGDAGTIDFITDSFSHTLSNFDLAEKVTNNIAGSFSIDAP